MLSEYATVFQGVNYLKKREKVIVIASILLKGFVFAVIFHYIMGAYLGIGYPLNTFLFHPGDKFMDYINSINIVTNLNPYMNEHIVGCAAYFPFAYLLLYFFSFIGIYNSLLLYSALFILYFVYYCKVNILSGVDFSSNEDKKEFSLYILIFSLLSYPFLFVLDRGNIESLLFICLSLFLIFYERKKYWYSVFFLTIAAAMKAYPLIFVVLFIVDNRKKYAWYTVMLTAIISLIALLTFQNGVVANINGLINQLQVFNAMYIVGYAGQYYNSSLFGMIKLALYAAGLTETVNVFIRIYPYLVLPLVIYIVWYVIKVETQQWKRITLLTFSIILFPQVSADYKLVHVYLPLFAFLNQCKKHSIEDIKENTLLYCKLFAFLLIPKQYFFIKGVSLSVIINPIILIIMMVLIIREGYKMEKAGAAQKYGIFR